MRKPAPAKSPDEEKKDTQLERAVKYLMESFLKKRWGPSTRGRQARGNVAFS